MNNVLDSNEIDRQYLDMILAKQECLNNGLTKPNYETSAGQITLYPNQYFHIDQGMDNYYRNYNDIAKRYNHHHMYDRLNNYDRFDKQHLAIQPPVFLPKPFQSNKAVNLRPTGLSSYDESNLWKLFKDNPDILAYLTGILKNQNSQFWLESQRNQAVEDDSPYLLANKDNDVDYIGESSGFLRKLRGGSHFVPIGGARQQSRKLKFRNFGPLDDDVF
ncbi:unnamed protein product [Spodoptera exigua]|nr:unnamed protein product [Spodoptera exigua]